LDFPEKTARKLPGGTSTNPTPYSLFLSTVSSFSHKLDVFEQGDFLNKFHGSSNTALIESIVLRLHNSIIISKEKEKKTLPDLERPVYFKISGSNPKVMSEYLTSLVNSAKEKTIASIRELASSVIKAEVNIISAEIDNLRSSAEEKTRKDLMFLIEATEIAKNLNIQNNNLDKLNNQEFQVGIVQQSTSQSVLEQSIFDHNSQTSSDIRIVNNSLPLWFLYGEKALQQELRKHKNRSKKEIVLGVAERKIALREYNSLNPSLLDIKVVTISQPGIPATGPIQSKNRTYVLTGMLLGLLIGIAMAYIRNLMDHLKQRQQSITSTEKP
jgi:LPS O-antigen subunit length determinant protein (WzzB/FepE family)